MSWEPICSHDTPYSALPEIIERVSEESLAMVRQSLAEQLDPAVFALVMVQMEPIIRERARVAIEAGWLSLQPKQ